jgi:hypothetical protein
MIIRLWRHVFDFAQSAAAAHARHQPSAGVGKSLLTISRTNPPPKRNRCGPVYLSEGSNKHLGGDVARPTMSQPRNLADLDSLFPIKVESALFIPLVHPIRAACARSAISPALRRRPGAANARRQSPSFGAEPYNIPYNCCKTRHAQP